MREPPPPSLLAREGGDTIAYRAMAGSTPGVMFCGGFMSDMTGTKATALEAHCRSTGRAFVRFDYSGHGQSGGAFRDGTIGAWRDDALAVLDRVASGPQILVGSSMGGWIVLLIALARPERVAGLVGVAAAPDFTEDLIWSTLDDEGRRTLTESGEIVMPCDYGDDPYPITMSLIEEGRDHLLLRAPIALDRPIHLLQGMRDEDVPWRTALTIAELVESERVTVELVKDGDHRLSRDEDLARLCAAVDAVANAASNHGEHA
ncbi:MAG: alpha/beta hydrolase [Rhodospirillales bacterium]|nr:alpha/beta hydrolase [Rhodospirillales bacterium]